MSLLEEMGRFISVGAVLLCFGLNFVRAKTEDAYFVLGKTLVLGPPGTYTIDGVEWRHNDDIAAEWSKGGSVEYYRNFKGRTVLDTETGVLTISSMTKDELGVYTLEINSKRLDVQYTAKAIEEIKHVDLWVRPKGDLRELSCNGNVTKAGPVTYWWDIFGNGTWFQWEQKLDIENNETTQRVKTFSCKIRNPVGEMKSEPRVNPFYKDPNTSGLGALAVIPIVILVAVGLVIAYKKGFLKKCLSGQKVDPPKEPTEAPLNEPPEQP